MQHKPAVERISASSPAKSSNTGNTMEIQRIGLLNYLNKYTFLKS